MLQTHWSLLINSGLGCLECYHETLELISSDQWVSSIPAQYKKLTEFRQEVKEGQEGAAAKALKRVQLENPYTYRRKENEDQVKFNSKVQEVLQEADAEMEVTPKTPALDSARTALEKV